MIETPNERFKSIKLEKTLRASAIRIIDENEDFNPDSLCLTCNHLRFFMHGFDVYKADDPNELDLMVWNCKEEKCDCISVMPIIPST